MTVSTRTHETMSVSRRQRVDHVSHKTYCNALETWGYQLKSVILDDVIQCLCDEGMSCMILLSLLSPFLPSSTGRKSSGNNQAQPGFRRMLKNKDTSSNRSRDNWDQPL